MRGSFEVLFFFIIIPPGFRSAAGRGVGERLRTMRPSLSSDIRHLVLHLVPLRLALLLLLLVLHAAPPLSPAPAAAVATATSLPARPYAILHSLRHRRHPDCTATSAANGGRRRRVVTPPPPPAPIRLVCHKCNI